MTQRLKNTERLRLLTWGWALAGVCVTQGCRKPEDATPAVTAEVEIAHLERGTVAEHIVADATLSPLAQAAISPKITAPVRTYYVQRGSKVKQGQLLAVLEHRDLAAQALDNQGQYTAAAATYNMATKAQVPEDYAKAQLDAEQAKAQLDLQEEIVVARKRLFEQGAIPGRDLDTAVAAAAQAQAAYDTANNHYLALKDVSRAASLKLAAGQLSSAKGKYNYAQAQVGYAELRSPIAGIVTDRPLFAGETATTGAPLVTVMDTSSLVAKVHLSQAATQRLSVGNTASVEVPGVDEPLAGKITLISPAVDPGSSTVEVWITVDNRAGNLKAGTPVHASVEGRTARNAITVPLGAVLTAEDGNKSVMVVDSKNVAHKVAIQLGIDDGKNAQVLQGLRGSEVVITQGAYGLSDGTTVTTAKPDAGGSKE